VKGSCPPPGYGRLTPRRFVTGSPNEKIGPWRFRLPTAQETTRHPLNAPSTAPNDATTGYWYFKDGRFELAPAPQLAEDVILIQSLQWQIEHKLLDDWLILYRAGDQPPRQRAAAPDRAGAGQTTRLLAAGPGSAAAV
jgi:hypothetical protein